MGRGSFFMRVADPAPRPSVSSRGGVIVQAEVG